MKIKKIFIIFLVIILSITLFGCRDKKSYNDLFTVAFYSGNDSSSIESTKIESLFDVENGSKIEKPEDPTAMGLSFGGWYKEKLCINPWVFEEEEVTKSLVLYAKWTVITFTITYHFDSLGGDFMDQRVDSYDVFNNKALPKAKRTGGLFVGWILTPTSQYKVGDTIVKSTSGYTSNLNLYAYFTKEKYTVRFIENLPGATKPTMRTIEYEAAINFPVSTDPSGKMKFVGWFSKDGTNGDWGFQYVNGAPYLGLAKEFDSETGTWIFDAQGTNVYGKWEEK